MNCNSKPLSETTIPSPEVSQDTSVRTMILQLSYRASDEPQPGTSDVDFWVIFYFTFAFLW